MNEHEVSRETLTLAAAGALDATELRRVQMHAETCEACRRELEVWAPMHAAYSSFRSLSFLWDWRSARKLGCWSNVRPAKWL